MSRWTNEPTNQWIIGCESMKQRSKESKSQRIDDSVMGEWISEWMNQWISGAGVRAQSNSDIKKGQKQSQSPESVAPNVGAENSTCQNQSPLHTSRGSRETMIEKQKVNNKESITLRKPGGSKNPWEDRKSTTKSRSPLAGGSRNPKDSFKRP